MRAAEQRAKGHAGFEWIDHQILIWDITRLVQRAARNNAVVDRAENERDQPSDHDAPDQAVDPYARRINWRVRPETDPTVGQSKRHEQRRQHAKDKQHDERGARGSSLIR